MLKYYVFHQQTWSDQQRFSDHIMSLCYSDTVCKNLLLLKQWVNRIKSHRDFGLKTWKMSCFVMWHCNMSDWCQCVRWTCCLFVQDRWVSCTGRCDQNYMAGRTGAGVLWVREHEEEEVENKLTWKAMTEIARGLASVTCCTELCRVTCQQTAICSQEGRHLSHTVPNYVEFHMCSVLWEPPICCTAVLH